MPTESVQITPRCLSKGQAAAYLGISPRTFDERVRAGRMPKSLDGTNQWDKVAIDRVLDKMSGLGAPEVPSEPEISDLERFKAERAARRAEEARGSR